MLLKLNQIRNKANAYNAIHLIDERNMTNTSLDDIIRFPFEKIMIELELFDSDESSAQSLISDMKRFETPNFQIELIN